MRTGARAAAWSAALTALLAAVVVVSAAIGPVTLDYVVVAKAAVNAVAVPSSLDLTVSSTPLPYLPASVPVPGLDVSYVRPFSLSTPETAQRIVGQLRLPRIVLGAVVGFALGAAGTVMQGFFRNPMADPSIIGVSSGAAVGAVAAIAVPGMLPVGPRTAAFAGALATAFLVYAIATEGGRTPVATLLLAGVAVQTFLGAVISYLLVMSGRQLREAVYWLMGNLRASTWGEVEFALPVVLAGFLVLLAFARDLNVLLLGETDATHLGVEVERTKRLLLGLASVVTAASVAVVGVVGFVGLIVPHMLRLIVGPDHRILLPTSALAGASFLVATDTLARSGPAEVPVGIVTAALGAPFFLFLLRRREVTAL
ncbi:vitamin B12 ABC transporter permease BtuC [Halostella litorea]|uniref:vitamin B12 ABC transporter permease BtuC n=1 Tax=Halostella litorea TaxID=2528831 RepID=UPI0010924616|nr:vitamin B12 ABC transporter permease BtuC [Halostella litorea]